MRLRARVLASWSLDSITLSGNKLGRRKATFSGVLNRVYRMRKAVFTSALNQIVSSGTNYLLNIFLVRTLSPEEFGIYGIGFATSFFLIGIGNASTLTQMVVNMPTDREEQKRGYASHILSILLCFAIGVISIGLGVSFLWPTDGGLRFDYLPIAIALSSVAFLLKDFFVRLAYTLHAEKMALLINIAVALAFLIAVMAIRLSQFSLDASMALLVFGAMSIAGAAAGQFLLRIQVRPVDWVALIQVVTQIWAGGMWSVLSHIVVFIRGQAYLFLTAGLLGMTDVAKINAARLFVAPVLMSLPAINQVVLPRLVEARQNHVIFIPRQLRWLTIIPYIGIFVLGSAVWYLEEQLVPWVLGDKYTSLKEVILIWYLIAMLTVGKSQVELILIALRRFRIQATTNSMIAPVSLGITYIFIKLAGEEGALLALALSEAVLCVVLARYARPFLRW